MTILLSIYIYLHVMLKTDDKIEDTLARVYARLPATAAKRQITI